MTQPTNPLITASPTIHTPPPAAPSPVAAPTPQYIGVIGSVILDLILGQIAIALGNVTVLGQRPFAFLSNWGKQLVDRANEAYRNANFAQGSANWANAQLQILLGTSLSADVEGGVLVTSQFNGTSANNLGADFTAVLTDGSGAGNFGLNGTGRAVWKKSGGLPRRHIFRHNTPLATDYQIVLALIVDLPTETQIFGEDALTYLCARMNEDGDTFVYCAIAYNKVILGKCVSGTFTNWSQQNIELGIGDQIEFLVGTDASDYKYIVKQNGVVRLEDTETADFGAGYLYVGVGARATTASVFLDQHVPAQLEAWAAADRLATRT